MKAIILAAGYAVRLGDIAKDAPKALLSVAGKPMLTHLAERIISAGDIVGMDEIVVVSNNRFYEQILRWSNTIDYNVTVLNDGSDGPEGALGALGDFEFALGRMGGYDGDVFLAVGDNYFAFGLEGFFSRYSGLNRPLVMARRLTDAQALKRVAVAGLEPDGRVSRIVEKPDVPFSDVAVFGLYLYPQGAVRLLPEYFIKGGFRDQPGHYPAWLYRQTDVYAYFAPGEIYDVGTPDSLAHVRALYGD